MPSRPRRMPMPTIRTQHLPAPMGGLNTISAGSDMPLSDCVSAFNLVPAEYGLRTRLGQREHCTGLTGAIDSEVRSILPFAGSNVGQNRLFACTSTGIWDVSASSATPTQVLAFAVSAGDAGYGVSHAVVTPAGHFLLYTDEANGLHVYAEGTGTWSAVTMGAGAGQISGVDPAKLVFVMTFKRRVMLVERDTARCWYLAAGAIFGTATSFEFGTQFRSGGSLVGLWNWTVDGGAGLDDSLVALSSAGDVAIYQGVDIASATDFGLKGVWYVGGLPAGRRIATDFGGDMLVLTTTGTLPLSRLLSGAVDDRSQYPTAKIANLFNAKMLTRAQLKGWSLRLHPEDATLILTIPTVAGQATEQLAMPLARPGAWYPYRDLPIFSAEVWQGKFYFGTANGRVCINDGYVDGLTLAAPEAYTPVQWGLLSAFTNLGSPTQKRIQMIRPTLLSEAGAPAYEVEARYRYDFTEVLPVGQGAGVSGTWNSAVWDEDVWAGEYTPSQTVSGATGMGVEMAVAIRGTAVGRTVLVGMDVAFDGGGFL